MSQYKIDSRHFKPHVKIHKKFVRDLSFIYSSLDMTNKKQARTLLEYLVPWLGRHILGVDQDMANQIKLVQSGTSPQEAFDKIGQEAAKVSEPLIDVLYDLFIHVSIQNKKLKDLNESLEEKVSQRTKELSEANQYLEKLSITDPLTNLSNRRHAMHCMDMLWQESEKKSQPFSCFMMDVDYFKTINDTYGHDTGDLVLIKLANTIREHLRTDDILCRLGGDEFILLCPNTDTKGAQKVAEMVLQHVNQLQVESWKGSMSIGGATRITSMNNYDALIKAADDALYMAKSAGRNCIKFKT